MYTHCLTAEREPQMYGLSEADFSTVEDRFATMPVITAIQAYQPPNEEELHTSFELAISDRLIAVNRQLSLISGPLTDPARLQREQSTNPPQSSLVSPVVQPAPQARVKRLPALFKSAWQRSIIYASLALALMLIGFDLMGLLVLHTH